jgi:hypothetical protein
MAVQKREHVRPALPSSRANHEGVKRVELAGVVEIFGNRAEPTQRRRHSAGIGQQRVACSDGKKERR